MRNSYILGPQPSHETIKFGDGAHFFLPSEGATLVEFADSIDVLGARRGGAPISIDVEFKLRRTTSTMHAPTRNPRTH